MNTDLQHARRGYAAIGLFQPKAAVNVGGVLRAAGCYGAAPVAYTGQRYAGSPTDTMKAMRHIPLLHPTDLRDVIPHGCVPVAVDVLDGATCLSSYVHPESAFYIFGPEDGTLGPGVTDWCRDIVRVPTSYCMNLAATVNVVLYDRLAKRLRTTTNLFPEMPNAKNGHAAARQIVFAHQGT